MAKSGIPCWFAWAAALFAATASVAVAQVGAPAASPARGGAPASPFTCLFDTGTTSPVPLAGEVIAKRTGWTAVPEGDLTHRYAGDLAFLNDRLAVVLRRGAAGAEVYSLSAAGAPVLRATLVPVAADGAEGVWAATKPTENSPAAVAVEASFQTKPGQTAAIRFRLTAGELLLEVRGGAGLSRVIVRDQARYVVVPDFFADDIVFDPASLTGDRVGLPTENQLLGLVGSGEAITAYVWGSNRQNADLLLAADGGQRRIAGYAIDLTAEQRLWLAILEPPTGNPAAKVWHAQPVIGADGGADLVLDWTPPFPAKWRASAMTVDGGGHSAQFAEAAEPGAAAPAGPGSVRGWFEGGKSRVRLAKAGGAETACLLVTYPIDRSRATPLTAFCLVDVLRNALGVGPCQYVLDVEGLGAKDTATPEPVTHWVEKQLEKKPAKRDPDAIREQLQQMTKQVQRSAARIEAYRELALRVRRLTEGSPPTTLPLPAAITRVNRSLARALASAAGLADTPAQVAALASELGALAAREDAVPAGQTLGVKIRAASAAQDYALAKFRMAARQVDQECRLAGGSTPVLAEVQKQVDAMLWKSEPRMNADERR